jgi:plasmid stabilization system protein ParE
MSYRVRFTKEAEADLDRLTDFPFQQADGDWATIDRALESIWQGMDHLAFSPFGYRKADAENAFLRELMVGFGSAGYVVLFEIRDARNVTVLAIRHQREDDCH